MAAFGTQINPALGRVDYTPFLQGAQMAAAGRQRGTEVLQQGISQGFEDYLKKREQNAVLEGRNASLVQAFTQDPTLKQFAPNQKALDSLMAKMAKGGGLTLNDNMKLNAELQTTVDLAEKAREAQMKQAYAKQAEASANRTAFELEDLKAQNSAWTKYATGLAGLPANATIEDRIKLAVGSGMNADQVSKATGQAMSMEQLNIQREQLAVQKAQASLELAKSARDTEFIDDVRSGKIKGYVINKDESTGNEVITNLTNGSSVVIPKENEKSSPGALAVKYAEDYQRAIGVNDNKAATEALVNWGRATNNSGDVSYLSALLNRQLSTNLGAAPLQVSGAPKLVDGAAPPAATGGLPANAPAPVVDIAPPMSRSDMNEAVGDKMRAAGLGVARLVTPSNWRNAPEEGGAPFSPRYQNKSKLDDLMTRYELLSNKNSETGKRLLREIEELSKKKPKLSPLK